MKADLVRRVEALSFAFGVGADMNELELKRLARRLPARSKARIDSMILRAHVLSTEGRFKEAIDLLKEVIRRSSYRRDEALCWLAMGWRLFGLEEAHVALKKVRIGKLSDDIDTANYWSSLLEVLIAGCEWKALREALVRMPRAVRREAAVVVPLEMAKLLLKWVDTANRSTGERPRTRRSGPHPRALRGSAK